MTPMFIKMTCIFCKKPLIVSSEKSFYCMNCQTPKYNTKYKQEYCSDNKEIILDYILIDKWSISRWHNKNAITYVYYDNKSFYKFNSILELPWHDIELVKHKLSIYSTFS